MSGNPREVFSLRRTCQLKMFGLNGGWDFKFSSASVWTHKTLLELELFVHSWGPAWTHKAHYKTSLVWAVCPLLEKYCCLLWEQCFCPVVELLLTVGAMLLSSMGALFLDSSPCWAEVTHHAWDLHPDQFILRDIDCSNSVCENGKRYQRCSR